MLARDENKSMSPPKDFAHDKLSENASLMQINVGFKEWIGFKGKGVPFGLTKGGTMEKDNPNVYEIHDQVCKCPYAREIKFIQV